MRPIVLCVDDDRNLCQILGKALSGEEVEDYVTAVRQLSGMRAPTTCHRVPPLVPPQCPPSTEVIMMSRD